jgi:hypothetical protein
MAAAPSTVVLVPGSIAQRQDSSLPSTGALLQGSIAHILSNPGIPSIAEQRRQSQLASSLVVTTKEGGGELPTPALTAARSAEAARLEVSAEAARLEAATATGTLEAGGGEAKAGAKLDTPTVDSTKKKRNHNRIPNCDKCKEKGKVRGWCVPCGGSRICEHKRQKRSCKECGGKDLCTHGRLKSSCKECGKGNLCQHNRRKRMCKECGGAGICKHGRDKYICKECGGSAICIHKRVKYLCKECPGASGICAHGKRKQYCKDCCKQYALAGGARAVLEHRTTNQDGDEVATSDVITAALAMGAVTAPAVVGLTAPPAAVAPPNTAAAFANVTAAVPVLGATNERREQI